ncbi:hypothetical protein NI17_015225 [Thermobifida halotolerans]|uniref:Uncharacterized protein n=2 Tax=Thermobifida halotolerans TaxID=483545 RepID=A0A399G3X7_9ACTN|nr:hypothetical protein [Thermobifida halotolerans]UOE18192.1 hypothetical protein NI17_015225 [Thermobifida halotolerans]
MRIYLPATLGALTKALAEGGFRGAPYTAYAVTPALRARHGTDDEEELEYAAMEAAAEESLRLLGAAPDEPARRVVVAAEVPDAVVRAADSADSPAAVLVEAEVPLKRVASAHVDDETAAPDIAAGRAEDHELLWYATQELRYL